MLLIDFKITVADIVNPPQKNPEFGQFLVQILLSAFQKQNDSVNGNSNNFQRNKGDRVDYLSSGVTLSDIWEFFVFYKLKKSLKRKSSWIASHRQCKNCMSGKILFLFNIQIHLQIFKVIKCFFYFK